MFSYLLALVGGLVIYINLPFGLFIILIDAFYLFKKKLGKKIIIISLLIFLFSFLLMCFSLRKSEIKEINSLFLVIESKKNYIIVSSLKGKYYVYLENNPYQVFDFVYIKGNVNDLKFKTYESMFDFNSYLKNKGVYYALEGEIKNRFLFFIRYKNIRSFFLDPLDENAKGIVSKLIFNFSYSSKWNNLISNLNLSYVFFSSSIYVYFFIDFIKRILMKRYKEEKIDIFIIILLFLYIPLVNYKISLIKLFIFYILGFLKNKNDKFDISKENKIALTWGIILLLNPLYILNDGFIISFSLSYFMFYASRSKRFVPQKYRNLYFSFLINVYIIPFLIKNDYKFSIFNIFIPYFFFPLIVVYIFLLFIFSFVRFPFFINKFSSFLLKMVLFIKEGNLYIVIGKINFIFLILFELILCLGLYFVECKRYSLTKYALILEINLILITSLPLERKIGYEVCFINVGQGDSTLIITKNETVLIDTGGVINIDIANEVLIPYFHKKKIKKIDALLITHDDYDHSGAKEELIKNFKISKVYENNFYYLKVGSLNFKNLNYGANYEDTNDNSLVLYLNLYNKNFLFMGDAPSKIEKKIIKENPSLKVDYLKVGHHGSSTSSSEEFINYIKPKEAIISCGINNKYNHPSKSTIKTLNKNNVKIRRTDEEGTIVYRWNY